MLQQLRDTHMGAPGSLGETYTNEEGCLVNDKCFEEWDEILDHMIFLLGEMDEETCSKKNQYEEELNKAHAEFTEKYGAFGDGLKTEKELEEEKKNGTKRMYFPEDEPNRNDLKELRKKWYEEEMKKSLKYLRSRYPIDEQVEMPTVMTYICKIPADLLP
jgi:hypothetical protein